jgi:hypothetical protein
VSSYVYVCMRACVLENTKHRSLNCVRQQKASEAMGLLGLGYMRLGYMRTGYMRTGLCEDWVI